MGLLNGALFVWIFRKRSIFFQLLGSWAISFAAAYYFLWYAKGYDGFGLWSLWLAYGMTGLMVAEIIALPLLFILALVSIPKMGNSGRSASPLRPSWQQWGLVSTVR